MIIQTLTLKDLFIDCRKNINEGNLQAMHSTVKANGIAGYCCNVNPKNPEIRCIVGSALNEDIISKMLAEHMGSIPKINEDYNETYVLGLGDLRSVGLISVEPGEFTVISSLQAIHDDVVAHGENFKNFMTYFEQLEKENGLANV